MKYKITIECENKETKIIEIESDATSPEDALIELAEALNSNYWKDYADDMIDAKRDDNSRKK
jgi:hypothetical protein